MRRLDLDYSARRSVGIVAYVLIVTALVVGLDLGSRYRSLNLDIELKRARLAKTDMHSAKKGAIPQIPPEEYAFARQSALRLSLPWQQLFQALESAANHQVALLAIEPDAQSRTVTISGEARDYLSTLSYVATLGEQRAVFSKVYLAHHEIRNANMERPVAFKVSAVWKENQ